MNAHEFINCELEIDLNNPYVSIKKENVGIVDDRDDAANNGPLKDLIMCKLVIW